MLPMLYDEKRRRDLLDITWERYKSAAAALYLTQYFAKDLRCQPLWTTRFLNPEEHNHFKERILTGTWEFTMPS